MKVYRVDSVPVWTNTDSTHGRTGLQEKSYEMNTVGVARNLRPDRLQGSVKIKAPPADRCPFMVPIALLVKFDRYYGTMECEDDMGSCTNDRLTKSKAKEIVECRNAAARGREIQGHL
jgi:hypothetical protein